jgi:hypothetical protein
MDDSHSEIAEFDADNGALGVSTLERPKRLGVLHWPFH